MSEQDAAVDFGSDAEKQARVKAQFNELKGRNNTQVTCGCGRNIPVRFAYQCLYCGEWFCKADAEAHFGKTIKQYKAEKSEEVLP